MQAEILIEKKPSLLRQIVDKVDVMTNIEQHALLIQLNKKDILDSANKLDKKWEYAFQSITDEDIATLVSEDRKAYYKK
jgi:hypothetical protein